MAEGIPPPIPSERNYDDYDDDISRTSQTILQSKDSRRILMDMGFSKHRA